MVMNRSARDTEETNMEADDGNLSQYSEISKEISVEPPEKDLDGQVDTENKSDKKKEKSAKSKIPSNIAHQINSLPDVKKYIEKLLHKLESRDREIKKLKRRKGSTKKQPESPVKTEVNREDVSSVDIKPTTSSSLPNEDHTNNTEENKPTPDVPDWGLDAGVSLADQVREAAENVLQESGFVYQESIGLYYDRSTGYYYDQNTGLYYDGINKTYYTYDEENNLFHVYHQIDNSAKEAEEEEIANWEFELKKRKKQLKLQQKKLKRAKKEESEEEEGQCSESTESESEEPAKVASTVERLVPAEEVTPCMRLMVLETQLKSLKVGTLFLVTCTGGTLGREGSTHAVCIPDINVSKHHAKFTFEKGEYLVCDLGSRNGTFLDGSRLSVALQESDPKAVQHGSELRVGCTKITCHIHPGNETCGHCEPGLVQQEETRSFNAVGLDKDAKHRDELLRLRRRFALTGQQEPDVVAAAEKAGYQDRAGQRRQTVGSIHHGAKTESASLDQAVPKTNKGFKLLSKMGWQSGQALGKDGGGITEPIPLEMRVAKAGLGSDQVTAPVVLSKVGKRKQETWSKTRDRYQQLPESRDTFQPD